MSGRDDTGRTGSGASRAGAAPAGRDDATTREIRDEGTGRHGDDRREGVRDRVADRTDRHDDRRDRRDAVVGDDRTARHGGVPVDPATATVPVDRHEATRRQKDAYGGVKVGSAFFGFLTATGMAVLLTALLAAAGTAVGVSTGTSLDEATNQATQGGAVDQTVGIVGGIVLLVILFLAYYAGGYVAGRMARFNGLRQGIAVWLWAVVVAAVVAVVAATAGQQYDVLGRLNSFPRIPVGGNLTTAGIIALVAVAVAALVGAVLGGLAGMRFHRKVDRAAFEPVHD